MRFICINCGQKYQQNRIGEGVCTHPKFNYCMLEEIPKLALVTESWFVGGGAPTTTPEWRKCPVCRFHKPMTGDICKRCVEIGYVMLPNGKTTRLLCDI